jgi:hypothetical protein
VGGDGLPLTQQCGPDLWFGWNRHGPERVNEPNA